MTTLLTMREFRCSVETSTSGQGALSQDCVTISEHSSDGAKASGSNNLTKACELTVQVENAVLRKYKTRVVTIF